LDKGKTHACLFQQPAEFYQIMRSDKLDLKLRKQSLDQLFRCLLNMEAERTRRNSAN